MLVQRNQFVAVMALLVLALLASAIPSAEGQFMNHLISRRPDRNLQKLLKEIGDLDLSSHSRPTRRTNQRTNMMAKKSDISTTSAASNDQNLPRDECALNSSDFNYDGYDCVCFHSANGRVHCTKQPHSIDLKSSIDRSDYIRMVNNIERLIDQLARLPLAKE